MTDWILQTHFDSLSELIPHIRDRSSSVRAAAELDGLVIAGEESVEIAKGVLASPESEEGVSAATLVAFELQATTLCPDILNLLCGKNPYLRNGVRSGLRLSKRTEKVSGTENKQYWLYAVRMFESLMMR